MAGVLFARLKQCARPLRLVGRVGIVLGFEAHSRVARISVAVLGGEGSVEEVARVYLYARLVGVDIHAYACGRTIKGSCYELAVVSVGNNVALSGACVYLAQAVSVGTDI